jgi:arylsulfatase A-like enzyme
MVPLLALAVAATAASSAAAAPKPHVLFFLADDYGHYDISYNNPEAPTPTLHALASEGVILNRHYVYQYCSPTRSSFLSGRLPIHVNTANHPTTVLGGVDLRMQTIAEALKSAGYRCHTAGKWHAGGHSWGQLPTRRGFDTQLGYLNGMEDHYTQRFNQLKGVDLWSGDGPGLGLNGSYGSLMYARQLVGALGAHDYAAPVFVYAAWQNTHSPLQVPERYLDPSIDTEVEGGATKQSYFGMTKCMDECVGNVTRAHKARGGEGAWANTLVIFSADNGGETFAGGNNCACAATLYRSSCAVVAQWCVLFLTPRWAFGASRPVARRQVHRF